MIDFNKTFDVVPHVKLIYKLTSLGVCIAPLQWLLAFPSGRTQSIKINNHLSNRSPVTSGIIQGDVLGLILFILCINNLPATCKDIKFELFANVAKGYKTIKHQRDRVVLQHSFDAL